MKIRSPVFWAVAGTLWLGTTVVTLLERGFFNPFTILGAIIFYIIAIVFLIREKKMK